LTFLKYNLNIKIANSFVAVELQKQKKIAQYLERFNKNFEDGT